MELLIEKATVYSPRGVIENGVVMVDGGMITAVSAWEKMAVPQNAKRVDAAGLHLVPGFIDLQVNGGFGIDLATEPTRIWELATLLPCLGVTSFLPTIISSPPEVVALAMATLAQRPADFVGAEPLGLHLEGPFLNPAKKGAHEAAFLQMPDLETAVLWRPENGVRLVTLAPELPKARQLVHQLVRQGVVVSAGHSVATFREGEAAIGAGMRYGTHLFNGMVGLHHRQPGLVGALLADERVMLGLIVDGLHLHPALVKLLWRLVGSRRLTLVSDGMAGMGLENGRYLLGNQHVTVGKQGARLADGTLAGSVLTLPAALQNLLRFAEISLEEVLPTVTENPAALLGLKKNGRVAPGYAANFLLLDEDLQLITTFIDGNLQFSSSSKKGG